MKCAVAVLVASILTLTLAGCAYTTIRALSEDPESHEGRQVRLSGRVTSVLPGGKVYRLDDGTGAIWVIAKGEPPQRGDFVTVEGTYLRIFLNMGAAIKER
ncbi:MAG: OB-fold nucleic acid binding domain-containing protein [bacterium]